MPDKKKGKGKKKSIDPAEKDKAAAVLKQFVRVYQAEAQELGVVPSTQLLKKVKSLMVNEENPPIISTLSVSITTTEVLGPQGLQALLNTLSKTQLGNHIPDMLLWKSRIGDGAMDAMRCFLEKDCVVTTLDLMDSGLTCVGMELLAAGIQENETLKKLALAFNSIGDQGALHLSKAVASKKALQDVDLQYCGIGALGGQAIADNMVARSCVRILDVQGNRLGPEGIAAIAVALGSTHALEEINIADNDFGHNREALFALAEGLQRNNTLTAVKMHLQTLNEEGVAAIVEAAKDKPDLIECKISERIAKVLFDMLADTIEKNRMAAKKSKKKKKKGKKKKKL